VWQLPGGKVKFSYKAGVGLLASIALFSAIARGGSTIISQTRSIDYYSQFVDDNTGQPIGSPQLVASKSAPDFGDFNASVGNTFGTYAQQTSSISNSAMEAIAFANTVGGETLSFQPIIYSGDSETSVTYQLDSSMTYSFQQGMFGSGTEHLLGPNNQNISFIGNLETTTGTIGPGQWTIQAISGQNDGGSGGGYDFSFSLTPEPTTLGIVLVPLLIGRRRCRG
jgi:hypothetical protein